MEALSQNYSFKCKVHSDENVIYLKINHTQDDLNNIFYCQTCIEHIGVFDSKNLLSIKSILQCDNQLIYKWPPLDNIEIYEQIKQTISDIEEYEKLNVQNEILKFLDDLKNEVFQKIDGCQKSMIKHFSQVQQFKDFSKVDILKNILQSTNIDNQAKEQQLREIIQQVQSKKQQNLQQITVILNEIQLQNIDNKFEISLGIKESILKIIDQIKFFQSQKDLDLLPDFNFVNVPFVSNSQQYPKNSLQLNKLHDNSIEIKCQEEDRLYLNSDFILQKNKKYVFRYQLESDSYNNQFAVLGIIDDTIKHLNYGQYDKNQLIAFQQTFDRNNQIIKSKCLNLNKQEKEDLSEWKDLKVIELRVDLQNQMVQILDYPNYNYIFSINDNIKNQLAENNYRLYLYMYGSFKVTLKRAVVCEQNE